MEDVKPTEPTHPEKKRGKGCKIALIILGVLLVIVVVAGYLICTNVHKLANLALTSVEDEIIKNLPEGYDESEVRGAFDDARRAIEEKRTDVGEAGVRVQVITKSYQTALEDDELTAEELDGILNEVRKISAPAADER